MKKNCKICNKEFEICKSKEKTAKYCSLGCRNIGIGIFFKGRIPWNKGLTSKTDERVKKYGINSGLSRKGKSTWVKWAPMEKLPNYKHGLSKNKEHRAKLELLRRHRLGISKKYREKNDGRSKTIYYKKRICQRRRALLKNAGELSIKIIQLVYEDNIKQYGTLTCIYCLKPIEFGRDTLEHKQPLSRCGTNEYNNLAIACKSCNSKKNNKTEIEYREVINA